MKQNVMHYETLIKLTRAISQTKEMEDIALVTVESVHFALKAKGSALFLVNRKTEILELAAAHGLSREYLDKGPISAIKSIADSLHEGPVAIFNVAEDPRIQYPEEAVKEGIFSLLSVPILSHGRPIGALRVYTAEPWDFTLADVTFVQAVAQMTGMALEMARMYKGYKSSIEVLKTMRDPKKMKSSRWTPVEGVPKSMPTPGSVQ